MAQGGWSLDGESYNYFKLAIVDGIGAATVAKLVAHFGRPSSVFLAGTRGVIASGLLNARQAEEYEKADAEENAQRALEACAARRIKVSTKLDTDYPVRFREDPAAPPVLFYRGAIEVLDHDRPMAVVGTRQPDPYGERMAEAFGRRLAESGVLVVSGGARGVDGLAHEGAMKGGGPTVAVLGSSLEEPYPVEHVPLFDRIAGAGGCVVSEFVPGTPQNRGLFPRRNRTVAALADGVVVVQGGEKSGALITAGFALEMQKRVFAVMGNADNANTAAVLILKQKGAEVVASPEDVLAAMHVKAGPDGAKASARPAVPLEGDEAAVYGALSDEPAHVDEVTARCGIAPQKAAALLLSLELKGAARQVPGMRYIRK